jgi:hypothetical protein
MHTSVPAALAALVLGLPVLFLDAAPAQAAAIFVETTPSTARPGDQVGIRASCTDNLTAAIVTSSPFGSVTVQPRFGFLTATTRVPTSVRPADYRVTLRCPDGKTATTTLHVVARVEPTRGPATGGGGTAPGRSAPMLIGGGLTAVTAGLVLAVSSLRRRRFG